MIAELLGVPEADRDTFRHRLDTQVPGVMDSADGGMMDNALAFLYDQFTAYVVDRREHPATT